MGKDLGTTAFATHDEEFNGNYRGQVMNNSDPLQAGRIQVQVLPMLVNVDSSLLPWAIPAMPLSSGSGTGYGSFSVPNIGSWVWVFFEQGSIYQPVYFAEAVDPTRGIPSFVATDYPNRRGFQTKSGIQIYTDDTTKTIVLKTPGGLEGKLDDATNTITFTQSTSGAFIEIDPTGQILINGTNIIITTDGTTTWTGTGNINITSSDNITVTGATVSINP
jgi:uncharacterized protein involved in type VI secretion and phage assembly